jgi:hypothetical protein
MGQKNNFRGRLPKYHRLDTDPPEIVINYPNNSEVLTVKWRACEPLDERLNATSDDLPVDFAELVNRCAFAGNLERLETARRLCKNTCTKINYSRMAEHAALGGNKFICILAHKLAIENDAKINWCNVLGNAHISKDIDIINYITEQLQNY